MHNFNVLLHKMGVVLWRYSNIPCYTIFYVITIAHVWNTVYNVKDWRFCEQNSNFLYLKQRHLLTSIERGLEGGCNLWACCHLSPQALGSRWENLSERRRLLSKEVEHAGITAEPSPHHLFLWAHECATNENSPSGLFQIGMKLSLSPLTEIAAAVSLFRSTHSTHNIPPPSHQSTPPPSFSWGLGTEQERSGSSVTLQFQLNCDASLRKFISERVSAPVLHTHFMGLHFTGPDWVPPTYSV